MTKQRFIDIVATAAFSAFIAFLQSLLMHMTSVPELTADPALAASVGGIMRAAAAYRV